LVLYHIRYYLVFINFDLVEFKTSIYISSIRILIFVLYLILYVDRLCPIIDFTSFRIGFVRVGHYFDRTLILWTLGIALCMAVDAKPVVCEVV
jgi:hypothetical protein